MYDLIGDFHGHASILKKLLYKMDYREENGVWKHPSRKTIFVGDYIDRGPEIKETLRIVRSMQESGHAIALMGNHEYNALAYHFELPDGSHLRKHSEAKKDNMNKLCFSLRATRRNGNLILNGFIPYLFLLTCRS